MVHTCPGRFADADAGWNSRSPINRSAIASEPRPAGFQGDDVDLAAGENPRAIASLTSGDRSGLAAAGIRARVRSARRDRAGAKAFRGSERDRTGTTAHFARSDDADFSGGDEPAFDQCVRVPAFNASGTRILCNGTSRLGWWSP